MNPSFVPLLAAVPLTAEDRVTFRTTTKTVVVDAPSELVHQLIDLCDGTRSLEDIVAVMNAEWDVNDLLSFIADMRTHNVLVDSRRISEAVWASVENPARFPVRVSSHDLIKLAAEAAERHKQGGGEQLPQPSNSVVISLLKRRQSNRSFSREPLSLQTVVDLVWSAYGEVAVEKGDNQVVGIRRTTPSAGGLFPLVIHVVLVGHADEVRAGVYRAHMRSHDSVAFERISDDTDRVARAFIDPLLPTTAQGIIIISGSFDVSEDKYGNRSMLFVPVEAGHAAQNVLLTAIESNVATVEIGGFVEALLADAIGLSNSYRPLTTIFIGRKGSSEGPNQSALETDWAIPMAGIYRPPFALASARVSAERSWSHGRDASPALAYIKAVAEAREWAACGNVPPLTQARYVDLDNAIQPKRIIEFHPDQYEGANFPFKPFNELLEYEWAIGTLENTGANVFVLADHVYFPYKPLRPYYCYANSSGVAAHPHRATAVEISTLELIERDSFMLAYLTQLPYPTVSQDSLPQSIQKRIKDLREIGFNVWIKDHSLDLAPAVFAFAQSDSLNFTICASCASFCVEHAVSHALMEVEGSILGRLQNGPPRAIQPHDVSMPLDHGWLYSQTEYFHQADFLVEGGDEVHFDSVGNNCVRTWSELMDRFAKWNWQLITIPFALSDEYGGNDGLHIIRSIVPGLVPMTFGYGQEPAGMRRIYATTEKRGSRPIRYRDLPKFPHPFA